MNDISTPTDIVTIEPASALTVFTTPQAIDPILARVRAEIDAFVPDVSTVSGRKAIASIAYKVAKAKTYLDNEGKKLADVQKEIPKKIDACRKHIRDTLDAWKDEVRAPLTSWEAAEESRINAHKSKLEWLRQRAEEIRDLDAHEARRTLHEVSAVAVGPECEEYAAAYASAKLKAIEALQAHIAAREKYEAEQAELARLRAEAAERAQKERDERIAREAEERARRDAEAKATAERKAAEDAATREREAAENRELALKLQAEQAERRAAEAEAKAKREAEELKARESAEAAKREADKAHRARINKAALDAIMRHGITEDIGKAVITLIAQREVPHVSISY